MSDELHPCPCCDQRTLHEASPGSFKICPVCGWEDDDAQFRDPTYAGGANAMSLADARRAFAARSLSPRDSDD